MGQRSSRQRRSRSRRPNNFPLLLVGAGALLLVVAMLVAFTGGEDAAAAREATPITLLDGSQVKLEDYRGHTLLVNFWASWCPPCRAEMPMLDAYYQAHRDDGFAMLLVNSQESAATAQGFIEQAGFTFPVGLDVDGRLTTEFAVTGLPVSIVYGPDGEVVYRHSGIISQDVLETKVTPLLEQ